MLLKYFVDIHQLYLNSVLGLNKNYSSKKKQQKRGQRFDNIYNGENGHIGTGTGPASTWCRIDLCNIAVLHTSTKNIYILVFKI